jgi:hypothetical protein
MRILAFGPYVLGCCAAAFGLMGCATNNSAPASALSAASQVPSIAHVLQYMPTRTSAPADVSGIQIPYQGGPVLVNPKTYLILWGYKKYGDPDGVAKLMQEYLKVEGGSGHNNIYTQYYEVVSGQKIYITNPKGQSGGIWDDEKDGVAPYPMLRSRPRRSPASLTSATMPTVRTSSRRHTATAARASARSGARTTALPTMAASSSRIRTFPTFRTREPIAVRTASPRRRTRVVRTKA